MRSVIDITIGEPDKKIDGIVIPIGMHISDDAWDDDDQPIVEYTTAGIFLSHSILVAGRGEIAEKIGAQLADQRTNYSTLGWEKINSALIEYLAKHDITDLVPVGWFEDPTSETHH